MSNLACDFYSLDDPVFGGGRYLRAFDHLSDIDSGEHHILSYVGSLMPFHEGFIGRAAFPSIPTIARSLRMGESTVRTKLRSLESKGYVEVEAFFYLNPQGKMQQGSNNYYLTDLAFKTFAGVTASLKRIEGIRKRTFVDADINQFPPIENYTPPPSKTTLDPNRHKRHPLLQKVANSLDDVQKHPKDLPSSCVRDLVMIRAEVEEIADAWKKVVGLPISDDEKMRFLQEYIETRGNDLLYLERIKEICGCVYLSSRAKSMNFLFKGLDMAKKNRAEIRHVAMRALNSIDTESQLAEVIEQLPALVAAKSQHFAEPSPTLVNSMLQDLIESARKRLHLPARRRLPANDVELRKEIDRLLSSCGSEHSKARLETIKQSVSRMNFARSLDLFAKYAPPMEASDAHV